MILKKWKGLLIIAALSVCTVIAGCGTKDSSDGSAVQMGGAVQGKTLALTGGVSNFAGPVTPAPAFTSAQGLATDGTFLYVADSNAGAIKKVSIATGEVTVLAGGSLGQSVDGIGTAAKITSPFGVTISGGNLYVTDTTAIRKIVIATGEVTTVAGALNTRGSSDGVGSAARFDHPHGITTDGTNLYVADLFNSTVRRVVIATGAVTTIAGTAGTQGSLDGIGSAASFWAPCSLVDAGAYLYVADEATIRRIDKASGAVTTVAGKAFEFGSVDGVGSAARFSGLADLMVDGGDLYITDSGNHTIRKMTLATGEVTTVAGRADLPSGSIDGIGTSARFTMSLSGLASDGSNFYVCDRGIRKIAKSTMAVTTLVGTPGDIDSTDGIGEAARFNEAWGVASDGRNLYVADSGNRVIRKVDISTGAVSTLAGSANAPAGAADGFGAAARFSYPYGVTTDGVNLYVADSGNNTIRKVVIATGEVTTLAGTAGAPGLVNGRGSAARFNFPQAITTDGINLYVADTYNNAIRKVVISTGAVSTFAGGANTVVDGTGTAAGFNRPGGITTDGSYLYVADTDSNKIRRINKVTAVVTTLAGSGAAGSTDGTGGAATFSFPSAITTDGRYLYVSDYRRVRKISLLSSEVSTVTATASTGGITTDGTFLYITNRKNIKRVQ